MRYEMRARNESMGIHRAGMEDFGHLLDASIKNKFRSVRAFALAVQRSHTLINNIISGDLTPPVDDLEDWGRALDLYGQARYNFIEAGKSARAKGKRDSKQYVEDLEIELGMLEIQQRGSVNALDEAATLLADMVDAANALPANEFQKATQAFLKPFAGRIQALLGRVRSIKKPN